MTDLAVKWLVWILGSLAILAGAATVLWGLFWDRARGRQRCPTCWYDMHGVPAPALQCPECGRIHPNSGALARTRRRYRWAIVGLLLSALGYSGIVARKAAVEGWPSAIPSTILVTLWPVSEADWLDRAYTSTPVTDSVFLELCDRIDDDELAGWQVRWWLGRVERYAKQHRRVGYERERATLEKLRSTRLSISGDVQAADAFFDLIAQTADVRMRHEDAPTIFSPPLTVPTHGCTAYELMQLMPNWLSSSEAFNDSPGAPHVGWWGSWDIDAETVVTTRVDPPIELRTFTMFDCADIVRANAREWKRAFGSSSDRASVFDTREQIRVACESLCSPDTWASIASSNIGDIKIAGPVLVTQSSPLRLLEVESVINAIRSSLAGEIADLKLAEHAPPDADKHDDPQNRPASVIRVYNLANILALEAAHNPDADPDSHIAKLSKVIVTTVDPDNWLLAGGEYNALHEVGVTLVISAPAHVHLEIEQLLRKLQEAASHTDSSSPP